MAVSTTGLESASTALIKATDQQIEIRALRCSFCGLGEGQVARLFEGRSRYICNECIRVCAVLLEDFKAIGFSPSIKKASWLKRLMGLNSNAELSCSFCGNECSKGELLLAARYSQICERCVNACSSIGFETYSGK